MNSIFVALADMDALPKQLEETSISGNGVEKTLASKYNLKDAIKLPTGEDQREWIAYNIFNFHKQICMLFGTVNDHCDELSCPKMTCGKKFEYLWLDESNQGSFPVRASQYIHHILDWVQAQLDDEEVFPSTPTKEFPANYFDTCRTIAKRLIRVYAHIYQHHLDRVRELKQEAHMNTSLKHFIYFIKEFNLVNQVDLEPLNDYESKI